MEFCCRWLALVVAIAAVAAAAAGIDGVIDGNGYWLPFIFFFSVSFLCFGISALSLYSNARYETIGITFSIVVSVIEMTDAHWTKKKLFDGGTHITRCVRYFTHNCCHCQTRICHYTNSWRYGQLVSPVIRVRSYLVWFHMPHNNNNNCALGYNVIGFGHSSELDSVCVCDVFANDIRYISRISPTNKLNDVYSSRAVALSSLSHVIFNWSITRQNKPCWLAAPLLGHLLVYKWLVRLKNLEF